MTHWAAQYIGKRWRLGAEGPDAYDCWSFTRAIQLEQFGILLPAVTIKPNARDMAHELIANAERGNWVKTSQPQEGDVILMARHKFATHVGVWIKANGTEGVLNCVQGIGVVFNPGNTLRANGWGSIEQYRRIIA